MFRVRRVLQAFRCGRPRRRDCIMPLGLNDHAMKDIGLTRMDVERLLSKPADWRDR